MNTRGHLNEYLCSQSTEPVDWRPNSTAAAPNSIRVARAAGPAGPRASGEVGPRSRCRAKQSAPLNRSDKEIYSTSEPRQPPLPHHRLRVSGDLTRFSAFPEAHPGSIFAPNDPRRRSFYSESEKTIHRGTNASSRFADGGRFFVGPLNCGTRPLRGGSRRAGADPAWTAGPPRGTAEFSASIKASIQVADQLPIPQRTRSAATAPRTTPGGRRMPAAEHPGVAHYVQFCTASIFAPSPHGAAVCSARCAASAGGRPSSSILRLTLPSSADRARPPAPVKPV